MLRARKKDNSLKPQRKLDKRSSRGMVFENEELRLRTLEISAEVDRGQHDVKKLKKENDILKREIWWLRDECEKLGGFLNGLGDEDDETELNEDLSPSSPGGAEIVEIKDGECPRDTIDAENMENLQKAYGQQMALHKPETPGRVPSERMNGRPARPISEHQQTITTTYTTTSHTAHIPTSIAPPSYSSPNHYNMLPDVSQTGLTYVILPGTHPVFGSSISGSDSKDNGVYEEEEVNLDSVPEVVDCFQKDKEDHYASLNYSDSPPLGTNTTDSTIVDNGHCSDFVASPADHFSFNEDNPGFSTIKKTTKAYVEKVRSNGEQTQIIRQASIQKVEVHPDPLSEGNGNGCSAITFQGACNSESQRDDEGAISVFTKKPSLVRLNSIEPHTVMFNLSSINQFNDVSTPEIIDELESQFKNHFNELKGVRVAGDNVYVCFKDREALYHLMAQKFKVRNSPVDLIDISSDTLVIAMCGLPHYVSDSAVNMLVSSFGSLMGDTERRYYKGVDTGERLGRVKLNKGVKLPKLLTICGCKIRVRLLKTESIFKSNTKAQTAEETTGRFSDRNEVLNVSSPGVDSDATDEPCPDGESSLEPIPEVSDEDDSRHGRKSPHSRLQVNVNVIPQPNDYTRTPLTTSMTSRQYTPPESRNSPSSHSQRTMEAQPPPLSLGIQEPKRSFFPDSVPTSPMIEALKKRLSFHRPSVSRPAHYSSQEKIPRESPSKRGSVIFEDNTQKSKSDPQLSRRQPTRQHSTHSIGRVPNGILRNTPTRDEEDDPRIVHNGSGSRLTDKLQRSLSHDANKLKNKSKQHPSVISSESELIGVNLRRKDSDKSITSRSSSSRSSSSKSSDLPWCGCWGNGCF